MERLCNKYGLRWRSYRSDDDEPAATAQPDAQLDLLSG
jgi:hypothetical protein